MDKIATLSNCNCHFIKELQRSHGLIHNLIVIFLMKAHETNSYEMLSKGTETCAKSRIS